MTDPALASSRLSSLLKQSFVATSQPVVMPPVISSVASDQVVPPQPTLPEVVPVSEVLPAEPSAETKLQLFDQVMDQLEQEQLNSSTQVTPAMPVTPEVVPSVPDVSPTPVAIEPAPITVAAPPTLAEVAPSLPTVLPTVVQQATNTLNPQYTSPSLKEAVQVAQPAFEVGGVQHVEQEVNPEISPEIAEYLEKVEDHATAQTQEIVISPQGTADVQTQTVPQPVVVLPLTPDVEKTGEHKPPSFSVRWLVEWSRKLMRMFSGRIIYRQT